MDDGHLTDSQGKKVDFRSSLLVMTSNLGAQALASLPEGQPSETARPAVLESVAEALPPEFVNRLDQIVLFNRLPRSEIAKIAMLEVGKVASRLRDQSLDLHISTPAVEWLAAAGYDPAYGARPVGRAVRSHLLNPLAKAIIGHKDGGAAEKAQDSEAGATRYSVIVDIDEEEARGGGGGGSGEPSSASAASSAGLFDGFFRSSGSATAAARDLGLDDEMATRSGLRIRLVDAAELEQWKTEGGKEWFQP